MLDSTTIQSAVDRMVAVASSPARIILFGSYARGTANEDSDLDLMVIEKGEPDKAAEYLRLRRAIGGIGVGVDVLIYTEEEALSRSQVPGTLPYWAVKEGRVLHDNLA